MALCEDESSGLARVTSDDRIVRRSGVKLQDAFLLRCHSATRPAWLGVQ